MDSRAEAIRSLFAEALQLAPGERPAFVAAACRGDPELGREVESLLAAHDSAGAFLDGLDPQRASVLLGPEGAAPLEERVGAYRLIRELGRGGMGVVYLAERLGGEVEQRVAL